MTSVLGSDPHVKSPDALAALRIREGQQAAVASIGTMALSTSDIDAVCAFAVRLLAEHLDAEMAKVLKRVPESQSLRLIAGVGWHDGLVGCALVPAGDDSQAGYTLNNAGAVVVADLRTETRFRGPQLLSDHGVVSGISVVIGPTTDPFGVLGAHTTRLRSFTHDDANFLLAVANVIADAAERAEAGRRLQEANARLERLVRSKDEFVAAVSHELRTPLTAVVGLSLELRDHCDRFLRRRGESSSSSSPLTPSTSPAWSRIFSYRHGRISAPLAIERRPMQVSDAVLHAIGTVTAATPGSIVVDVDESLVAFADPGRVCQILRNLLTNAIRHGGPSVRITAKRDGPGIQV
jgi:signal transduction histidine kinase